MNIPNTPMLGALVKVIGTLDINGVLEDTKKKLEVKFRHKPQVIDGNIACIKRAFDEVKNS
jgi:pyruvate ferredoxin oxidoreductase gamma subunit